MFMFIQSDEYGIINIKSINISDMLYIAHHYKHIKFLLNYYYDLNGWQKCIIKVDIMMN